MASNLISLDDLKLYSISRTVQDWKCPRSLWWSHEYGGKGLSSASTALELFLGISLHDSLAGIATFQRDTGTVDIDLIADTAATNIFESLMRNAGGNVEAEPFAHEQAALVEGLVRGFYRYVWPSLLQRYPKIISVEEPMLYRHDINGKPDVNGDFVFMSKPDLILADESGTQIYCEYKSSSSKSPEWTASWETAVQVHSVIRAVEQTTGTAPGSCIVQGLYKGYFDKRYKRQNSGLCYGYGKVGQPPFTADQISYDYKPGLRKLPVWEMEGGVKAWVDNMPIETLAENYMQSPPIFIREHLVDGFFRQRAQRQNQIWDARLLIKADPAATDMVLDSVFQQRFDQCSPSFGRGCQFKPLCHGGQSPEMAGFVARDNSHEGEYLEKLKDA